MITTFFDQFGFAAPLTIKANRKIEPLNTKEMVWDEKLPIVEEVSWKKWFENDPRLSDLQIPRCLFKKKTTSRRSSYTPSVTLLKKPSLP